MKTKFNFDCENDFGTGFKTSLYKSETELVCKDSSELSPEVREFFEGNEIAISFTKSVSLQNNVIEGVKYEATWDTGSFCFTDPNFIRTLESARGFKALVKMINENTECSYY